MPMINSNDYDIWQFQTIAKAVLFSFVALISLSQLTFSLVCFNLQCLLQFYFHSPAINSNPYLR